MTSTTHASALQVHGELMPRFDEILTPEALDFVAELAHRFGGRRDALRRGRYAVARPGHRLDLVEQGTVSE